MTDLIGVIDGGATIAATIDDARPTINVEIQGSGPEGKEGPPGPPGPPGEKGEAADINYEELAQHVDVVALTTYKHEQAQAATKWTINHDKGYFPAVSVTTYGGNAVIGAVTYIDENRLTVEFAVEVAGYAYLS